MTLTIGDIIYCKIPLDRDILAIAQVTTLHANSNSSIIVDILHGYSDITASTGWLTSLNLIIINFGQTDLNTVRQNYPEFFI
jgi:hypothetical protein